MKIESVKIENFRSFKDETVEFGDYNCLVGPNGAGKSNVLNALNVFFHETEASAVDLENLTEEDFHEKNTSKPIRITVTFSGLSKEAKEDLKDYVRQDKLVVCAIAEWDAIERTAVVLQHGMRAAMKDFAPFFKASNDGAVVKDLQAIFAEIVTKYPEIKAGKTKPAMTDALRDYETAHPEKCELIESADEFYGVSKGANRLSKYIQWVFVPAVKDAVSEQTEAKNTALGRLLARTVRAKVNFADSIKALREQTEASYDTLLTANQAALDDVSSSLHKKLMQWSHPGAALKLMWNKDPKKSVQVEEPFAKILAGEGQFQGELARLGHGLQRSYLLALLHELATSDEANAPRLLLAIEEPELFQHPPQEQHLAEVLQKLSEGNAQVFACTHSPYFVIGNGFEDVRLVRKTKGGVASEISRTTFDEVAKRLLTATGEDKYKKATGIPAKIHQALQPALKEMFFCPVLVLVEGLEDIAYITAGLHLTGLWEVWRQLGGHIVAVNGKSEFIQPLVIAQIMNIPTFLIFDADSNVDTELKTVNQQTDNARYQKLLGQKIKHEKDNTHILKLLGQPQHEVFPANISWQDNFIVWPENIGSAIEKDFQQQDWQKWKNIGEQLHGCIGNLGKNSLFIADLMTAIWGEKKTSPTLVKLCEKLIEYAKKSVA
jgi:putative ATP-dependent endonuclease of the OLD family